MYHIGLKKLLEVVIRNPLYIAFKFIYISKLINLNNQLISIYNPPNLHLFGH